MEFFDALVRYETELWNRLERTLIDAGAVSLAKLEALRVVARHPGSCRVNEIAHDLAITVGAASKLVDRLVRDGLVTRQPHPHDRRSALIVATSIGAAALTEARTIATRFLDGHLTGSDVEAMTSTLVVLRTQLGEDTEVGT